MFLIPTTKDWAFTYMFIHLRQNPEFGKKQILQNYRVKNFVKGPGTPCYPGEGGGQCNRMNKNSIVILKCVFNENKNN